MKTVGIIGGLGPGTTAKFYLSLLNKCSKFNKTQRPSILLWNVPIKFREEKEIIIKGINEEKILPLLIEGAKKLEKGGANFIVIPCNTVHIFIDQIRKSVKIPVLSIIEETTKHLKELSINKVGLLATTSTVKNKLFSELFKKNGIEIILPNPADQKTLGNIIVNLIQNKEIKMGKLNTNKIINKLKLSGASAILLACTDLQLLNLTNEKIKIIDTLEILLDSTVQNILN